VTFAPRYCDAFCAAIMTQFFSMLRCSFQLGVTAFGRNDARQPHKLVRRYGRIVRTEVVRLGNECTRLPFERSGGVLCSDPPALVCTAVANCRSSRAGCC